MELNIRCPHCRKKITLEVEIENPSDYFYDSWCPECKRELSSAVHDKIYNEVADEYIGRAEFARECREDR